jgi:hypothetical protein
MHLHSSQTGSNRTGALAGSSLSAVPANPRRLMQLVSAVVAEDGPLAWLYAEKQSISTEPSWKISGRPKEKSPAGSSLRSGIGQDRVSIG